MKEERTYSPSDFIYCAYCGYMYLPEELPEGAEDYKCKACHRVFKIDWGTAETIER